MPETCRPEDILKVLQIEITTQYHRTPMRMAKSKNTTIRNIDGNVTQLELSDTEQVERTVQPLWEKSVSS